MKKPLDLKSTTFGRFLLKSVLLIILAIFSSETLMAQAQKDILVSGIVTDSQGEALIGVNILVKGSGRGTITDVNGKFSVKVPNENTVLQFSYIGYRSKTKVVGNDRNFKIALENGDQSLEDVVIIGYGTSKRKDLTGSVGRVDMEELQKAPVKSFDEALAGRVAGVQVVSGDGQPGSNASVYVRGVGSVTQSTAPLYVVDGFPLEDGNFNSINPSDIESIDVLKDASSTAIYGARGSNGVVIITTKRGKSEKPTITYTGYFGVQSQIKKMSLMDSYEFVRLQNEDMSSSNVSYLMSTYLQGVGKTAEDYKNSPYLDWQSLCTNNNPTFQSHTLSLSSKTAKTAYTASLSYTNSDGLIVNSGYNRYQGRFTLDQDINDKLKVGFNANYAVSTSNGQISTAGTNPASSFGYAQFYVFANMWTYRPVLGGVTEVSDYEDYYQNKTIDIDDPTRINPYQSLTNEVSVRKNTTFTPNAYLQYKITKDLTLRSTVGASIYDDANYEFHNSKTSSGNPLSYFGQKYGVNAYRYDGGAFNFLNENTLTYNKKINGDHNFNAMIGFTNQQNHFNSHAFTVMNIVAESLGIDGINSGSAYQVYSGASDWTAESFYGRANYTYKDRYLFTATMRSDGSSRFAPGSRWGYFPSGAFAWRISEEPFAKKMKSLDNAKLRLSYGLTGNNRVGDYAYMSLIQPQNGSANWGSYISVNGVPTFVTVLSQMGNSGLKWETGEQVDLGLDLAFFKSRLSLEADYYIRNTRNLLLSASVPYYTGFSSVYQNVGAVRNNGLELSVNTVNIQTPKFKWTSSFNISFNNNTLTALNSGVNEILTTKHYSGSSLLPNYIAKVGQSVAQFYGYISDGVYQLSDFYKVRSNASSGFTYMLKEGVPRMTNTTTANVRPGDVKLKDLNNDGIINENDETVLGSPYPVHYGGFNNTFSYKNFDLSIFMQWSYGNKIWNANRMWLEGNNGYLSGSKNVNQFDTYANRWTYTNASELYPRVGTMFETTRYSDLYLEDGSYLRLKTVQLAYNVPTKLLKKIGIISARFNLTVQNLFVLTGYSGVDPEVNTSGSNLTPGYDFSAYPRTRVMTLGTNISF